MDLIDKVHEIASRLEQQADHINTEEATKNALIMPLIAALGYDVFNPQEVLPEFTADVGMKKGEKVDYAIIREGKAVILIECKSRGSDLNKAHASQLYRYFGVSNARFGILTNGVEYRFFTDLDEPNRMDKKPFFVLNISDFQEHQITELKKFTKSAYSLEDILATASKLKYMGAIKALFESEFDDPSKDFVKFFAAQCYDRKLTQSVVDQFTPIIREAGKRFLNEKINARLRSALTRTDTTDTAQNTGESDENPEPDEAADGVVTTVEELEGYSIVKAIVREVIDVKRVAMRDTKSYFGVLLDDNNRKPICRLHFNSSKKYLGLFIQKKEERVAIETIDDIFKHGDRLKATISEYEGKSPASQSDTPQ